MPEEPTGDPQAKPLQSAATVDAAGRIYVHLAGRIYALEEKESKPEVVWEYVTGSHAPGPVIIGPDEALRVHCADGTLHCLSFEGKQIYSPVYVGEALGYAAPIADAEGNTYVSAVEGGLILVDTDGRVQSPGKFLRTRQKLDAAGVIHDGVLYIGSEDGYIFAVELGGSKGKNLFNHAAEEGYTGWYIHSRPAITADGLIVVAGRDEHLYGFAPSGKTVWKTPMPGQTLASPVIDPQGQIYVGVSQSKRGQEPRGMLVCIDGNSHKIRWQYQASGPVESTPVVGDDQTVYFGDNAGVIHAVDFRGQPKWTAEVEDAVRSAGSIIAPERVAFGLDNETLVVLKCSSAGLAQAGWPQIGGNLAQSGVK